MPTPSSPPSPASRARSSPSPPRPHHLAEQLPPASFETPSERTASTAEPAETTEKGELSVDGRASEEAAGLPQDAEKAGLVLDDYPDGGLRAWRCVLLSSDYSRRGRLADPFPSPTSPSSRSVVGGAWCISFTSWVRHS